MSWIDRVQTDLVIVTGDGVVYTPQYVMASVSNHVEYNIEELVFIDVEGELVKRRTARGTQYDVEIKFQGADCVEMGKKFRKSADYVYKGTGFAPPWTVTHPIYDKLLVQPKNLTYDNSSYNVVTIRGTIIETIKDNGKAVSNDLPALIVANSAAVTELFAATTAASVPVLPSDSLTTLDNNNDSVYASIKAKLNGWQADVNELNNVYSEAKAHVNSAVYNTKQIIKAVQALYQSPANYNDTVLNRVKMLKTQLGLFGDDVTAIKAVYDNSPTKARKKVYESSGGAVVSGMCLAAVTNVSGDYDNMPDVLNIADMLIEAHNGYINNLCTLQNENGGTVDAYIPDHDSVKYLTDMVFTTTAHLYELSKGAKQKRSMYLDSASNIILLGHELYPTLDNDTAALQVKVDNNIGYNELMRLEKGREIVYYV